MAEITAVTYLKAADIAGGTVAKVLSKGRVRTAEETKFKSDILELDVEVNGIKFLWSINKSSQLRLAQKWGRDTKNWIGKELVLHKTTQAMFGTRRDVLLAYPKE